MTFVCPDPNCSYSSQSRGLIARHFKERHETFSGRGKDENDVAALLNKNKIPFEQKKVVYFGSDCIFNRIEIDFVLHCDNCTVFLEVDEWQHRNGYKLQSEIYRMDAVRKHKKNQFALPHFWIRYNPSPYPFLDASKPAQLTQETRENRLIQTIMQRSSWTKDIDFFVLYLFYDTIVHQNQAKLRISQLKDFSIAQQNFDFLNTGLLNDQMTIAVGSLTKSDACGEKRMYSKAEQVYSDNIIAYSCRFGCKNSYQSAQARLLHERNTHPDAMHTCKSCHSVFGTEQERDFHFERCQYSTNGTDHNFVCEKCPAHEKRPFPSFADLQRHKLIHDSTKTFNCPIEGCEKTYVTEIRLKTHIASFHENKKRKRLACDVTNCSYTTYLKSDLQRHKAVQHEIGTVENHFCVYETCRQNAVSYSNITNLNKHIRKKHSGCPTMTKFSYAREKQKLQKD